MDDEIKLDLDKERDRLLSEIRKQKNVVIDLLPSMGGIDSRYLNYIVFGMIYVNLQKYFVDLYTAKGMAQEPILQKDWLDYLKDNSLFLITELKKIYGS